MHVAFVDESETRDGFLFFSALIADEQQIRTLTGKLDTLMAEIAHEHPLGAHEEFHAHEMFQAGGPWKAVPPRVRLWAQQEVIRAIKESKVALCSRGIDKVALHRHQSSRHYPVNFTGEQEAFKHLLQRIQHFAERHKTSVIVIADERSDRDVHRDDLALHRLEGTPGNYLQTKFDAILDTVHFAPSHRSRMLQAADHYAFFYRRRFEVHREKDQRAEDAMVEIDAVLNGPQAFDCGFWP